MGGAGRRMELKRKECRSRWDNLPSLAISNIFCKSSIEDRLVNLPLVCKSWAQASLHPGCWASMIAESHPFSADDAFIKASFPYRSVFSDPFRGRQSTHPSRRLEILLRRAAGGTAVTSLFFFPFLTSDNDDIILTLIARCCPNLKHLSFHGSYNASEEVILELIRRCSKLELVDFSDSPYFRPRILEEIRVCCPEIRGMRRNGIVEADLCCAVLRSSGGFSNLRLLNLSDSTIRDTDLLNIICVKLQYLDIMRCQNLVKYMYLIKRLDGRIPQICYD